MPSEVAQLRQRIAEEYEAAHLGLCGYAISARHDFIQARMEAVNQHHEQLVELVGEEKAIEIVSDINDEIVEKYQKLVKLFLREEDMKEDAPLRAYQATSLELVAIGYLILHHGRCFDQFQRVSGEEREMTKYVQSFFDRLMTQLPDARPMQRV